MKTDSKPSIRTINIKICKRGLSSLPGDKQEVILEIKQMNVIYGIYEVNSNWILFAAV